VLQIGNMCAMLHQQTTLAESLVGSAVPQGLFVRFHHLWMDVIQLGSLGGSQQIYVANTWNFVGEFLGWFTDR
jgi:hypothetical protein